jgi:hypothetical protein
MNMILKCNLCNFTVIKFFKERLQNKCPDNNVLDQHYYNVIFVITVTYRDILFHHSFLSSIYINNFFLCSLKERLQDYGLQACSQQWVLPKMWSASVIITSAFLPSYRNFGSDFRMGIGRK